jgi:hypothetical protein
MNMFITTRIVAASAAALITVAAVGAASAAEPASTNQVSTIVSSDNQGASTPTEASSMKYCVSEQVTGSRLAQKVCKTKAEWAAEGVTVALKKKS